MPLCASKGGRERFAGLDAGGHVFELGGEMGVFLGLAQHLQGAEDGQAGHADIELGDAGRRLGQPHAFDELRTNRGALLFGQSLLVRCALCRPNRQDKQRYPPSSAHCPIA